MLGMSNLDIVPCKH